jgi:succinoglycan biosynthesis transport protein ExoP
MTAQAEAPPLQLGDVWAAVHRRRGVAALAFAIVAAAVLLLPAALAPPLYRAEATLAIDRSNRPLRFRDDPSDAPPPDELVNTQRELLLSLGVLSDALAMGSFPASPAYAGAADQLAVLRRRLHATVVRNSWVIQVSLEDEDPVRAEAGLRAVLDSFAAQQATQARERSARDIAFVEAQLREAEAKLGEAREAERLFRGERGIASTDPDANHITARIQSLATMQASVDERLTGSKALVAQVEAAVAIADPRSRLAALMRVDTISTQTVVGAIQNEIFELEGQEAALGAKYLERHPKLIEVRSRLTAKRAQLEETIGAARSAIEASHRALLSQREELGQTQDRLRNELNAYRESLTGLQSLMQRTRSQQQVCDELLSRRAQLVAMQSYDDRRMRIEAPPRSSPVARSLGLAPLAALAVLAGATAALAAAALADGLDRSLRDGPQLRRLAGSRPIGSLPECDQPPAPGGDAAQPAELAEAMRGLWAAVLAHPPGEGGCRVIVVASAADGDGRSTLAARLAACAALAGARVLLADADLRRPSLAQAFAIDPSPGLSELLAGEPQIAAQATAVTNLDVLPAGAPAANAGELLHSHCLAEWLRESRGHYDAIIIDTPPLARCVDAALVAAHADRILLLGRAGRTARMDIAMAVERLEQHRDRIAPVLLARGPGGDAA